ncbi:hypothetical protein N9937_01265 [bacterium]|nr:hypothetical protein [bacterium]
MANGNGSALTPAKIISICIAVTIAANGWSLLIIQEHAAEIAALHSELNARTDKRYRQTDAARDFKLVEFRFERNERNIDQCMSFIKEHRHDTHLQMLDYNWLNQ